MPSQRQQKITLKSSNTEGARLLRQSTNSLLSLRCGHGHNELTRPEKAKQESFKDELQNGGVKSRSNGKAVVAENGKGAMYDGIRDDENMKTVQESVYGYSEGGNEAGLFESLRRLQLMDLSVEILQVELPAPPLDDINAVFFSQIPMELYKPPVLNFLLIMCIVADPQNSVDTVNAKNRSQLTKEATMPVKDDKQKTDSWTGLQCKINLKLQTGNCKQIGVEGQYKSWNCMNFQSKGSVVHILKRNKRKIPSDGRIEGGDDFD
ncbi:hypothetical protein D5086_012068 [Populus alba]|uniref:Uncharacterized protein n=2 Tax=Populus alba TaxID=43335 RepID=A0A4U5QGT3_POPAL|nr:hypothetical protein D5086_0000089290 [Populus alba]